MIQSGRPFKRIVGISVIDRGGAPKVDRWPAISIVLLSGLGLVKSHRSVVAPNEQHFLRERYPDGTLPDPEPSYSSMWERIWGYLSLSIRDKAYSALFVTEDLDRLQECMRFWNTSYPERGVSLPAKIEPIGRYVHSDLASSHIGLRMYVRSDNGTAIHPAAEGNPVMERAMLVAMALRRSHLDKMDSATARKAWRAAR